VDSCNVVVAGCAAADDDCDCSTVAVVDVVVVAARLGRKWMVVVVVVKIESLNSEDRPGDDTEAAVLVTIDSNQPAQRTMMAPAEHQETGCDSRRKQTNGRPIVRPGLHRLPVSEATTAVVLLSCY